MKIIVMPNPLFVQSEINVYLRSLACVPRTFWLPILRLLNSG